MFAFRVLRDVAQFSPFLYDVILSFPFSFSGFLFYIYSVLVMAEYQIIEVLPSSPLSFEVSRHRSSSRLSSVPICLHSSLAVATLGESST